jgi:GNAT superfamily N-acetyltransferase
MIKIRSITTKDPEPISKAFIEQGWNKPVSLYKKYLKLQQAGIRDVLIAEYDQQFAGYLTLKWKEEVHPFSLLKIPEIEDFNVLIPFQRRGIGNALMNDAESRVKKVSKYICLGVGITKDYGPAHILYTKRNYLPNGNGLCQETRPLQYGESIIVKDDIIFHLIKEFTS